MQKLGIALQLYTLRDVMAEDFIGTLKKVAEIGYEGVEFAGYGGLSPQELREVLEKTGLQSVGSHVSLEMLRDSLDQVIEMNKAIGTKYVVCPYLGDDCRNTGWMDEVAEILTRSGEELAKHGIGFGYHNHSFEFEIKVGDELMFDALFLSTPADLVKVEMDVCWVYNAGYDPVEYINKYTGRLPLIHLKDLRKQADGSPLTVEVGRGEVNQKAVIEAAEKAGAEWLVVEQDVCQNPPLESAAISYQWLQDNYL